VPQGNTAAFLD